MDDEKVIDASTLANAPRGYPRPLMNITSDNLQHIVLEGEGTTSYATHYIHLDDNGKEVYSLKLSTLTVMQLRFFTLSFKNH